MRVLALDISSTRTGWAFGDTEDKSPKHGSFGLPSSGEVREYGRRFSAFRKRIIDLVTEHAPTAIWYEAPIMKFKEGQSSIHTIRMLCSLAAFAEEVAHTYRLECRAPEIKDIRKHFIGYSTGKSDELKLAVMKQCHLINWSPANTDESDAMAVWSYAVSQHKLRKVLGH